MVVSRSTIDRRPALPHTTSLHLIASHHPIPPHPSPPYPALYVPHFRMPSQPGATRRSRRAGTSSLTTSSSNVGSTGVGKIVGRNRWLATATHVPLIGTTDWLVPREGGEPHWFIRYHGGGCGDFNGPIPSGHPNEESGRVAAFGCLYVRRPLAAKVDRASRTHLSWCNRGRTVSGTAGTKQTTPGKTWRAPGGAGLLCRVT